MNDMGEIEIEYKIEYTHSARNGCSNKSVDVALCSGSGSKHLENQIDILPKIILQE